MNITVDAKSLEQQIIENIRDLPIEQQKQVLFFIEFLSFQLEKQQATKQLGGTVSAYDMTSDLAGCLDGGPSDLSTNKAYLQELKTE